jgi:hypothetical protein
MPCIKRSETGHCDHHQCPFPEHTAKGYKCVDIFAGNGFLFCEIGENCYPKCPYSWVPGDGSAAEQGAIAWNQEWNREWEAEKKRLEQEQ